MKRPEYLIEKLYQNYEEYSNAVFYERMELVEEAWELYGHLPAGERYARTFAYVAAKMSPVIQKWELVVGKIPETNLNQEQERRYESLCRLPGNSFDPAITIGSSEAMGEVDTSVSYERYAPKWFSAWGHNTKIGRAHV